MADPVVTIKLEADSSGVDKTFKQVKQKAEREGNSIADSFKGGFAKLGIDFGGLAKGAGIVGAIALAYKGFNTVLSTGFREAQATEDAINSLNTALKNTGQFTTRASEELVKYAQSLSDVTTVGGDAIISASSLIQSLGGLERDGLKRATKAALDLSAALGIDLNSAARLVGKAASGETRPLSSYGLAIEKGKDNAETFANALLKLEGRFGGAAESKVNTFSGALAQLNIEFGDLSKAVVGYLTNSSLLQGAIRLTTSLVKATTNLINPDEGTLDEQITRSIAKLDELTAKRERYSRLARIDALGFKNDSQKNLEATNLEIEALEKKISSLRIQNDLQREQDRLASNKTPTTLGVAPEDLQRIRENARLIGLTEEQVLLENFERNKMMLQELRRVDIEEQFLTEAEFKNRMLELERQYQEQLGNIKKKGAEDQTDIQKRTANLNMQLNAMASQAIAKATSMGIQSMVKSFILGEKSGESFFQSLIGMLGDMAIAMGEVTILAGVAMSSLFNLSAGQALIAGAGLVALGTVLKSFAGGKDGMNVGDGGGAVSTFESTTGSIVDQQERAEPETKVVVNIQGSVLDSDETGLRIANILKEASLNNNVKASVFA